MSKNYYFRKISWLTNVCCTCPWTQQLCFNHNQCFVKCWAMMQCLNMKLTSNNWATTWNIHQQPAELYTVWIHGCMQGRVMLLECRTGRVKLFEGCMDERNSGKHTVNPDKLNQLTLNVGTVLRNASKPSELIWTGPNLVSNLFESWAQFKYRFTWLTCIATALFPHSMWAGSTCPDLQCGPTNKC